jgi:hypothetical protein
MGRHENGELKNQGALYDLDFHCRAAHLIDE